MRERTYELVTQACDMVRFFGADYVRLWPGQDGWDYPFQVDYEAGIEWHDIAPGRPTQNGFA